MAVLHCKAVCVTAETCNNAMFMTAASLFHTMLMTTDDRQHQLVLMTQTVQAWYMSSSMVHIVFIAAATDVWQQCAASEHMHPDASSSCKTPLFTSKRQQTCGFNTGFAMTTNSLHNVGECTKWHAVSQPFLYKLTGVGSTRCVWTRFYSTQGNSLNRQNSFRWP